MNGRPEAEAEAGDTAWGRPGLHCSGQVWWEPASQARRDTAEKTARGTSDGLAVRGCGSIPGQGTEILRAMRCGQKVKRKQNKQVRNSSNSQHTHTYTHTRSSRHETVIIPPHTHTHRCSDLLRPSQTTEDEKDHQVQHNAT